VIRPGGIGDAVLFIPMLQALRRAWPDTRLDLLLEKRNVGVVAGTGIADGILLYDRLQSGLLAALRGRYDLVIDTEQFHALSAIVALLTRAPRRVGFGTNRRRLLLTDLVAYDKRVYEVEMFLRLAERATGEGASWNPELEFYPLTDAARSFAEEVLEPFGGQDLLAIHPGASIPERRWPPERYARVARLASDAGCAVVVLGGPTDVEAAGRIAADLGERPHINLAGRSNLQQAAAVVARCKAYVSADTGLLHLAYGVGTPTVHLFGPGVLSKWGPPGRRYHTVAHATECSPCTSYGYTPPCCQGMRCMLGITPEQVFSALEEELATKRVKGP
jgi:lipopolysaccharide heptosyltransferase II